jgi:hypothetical protein
MLGSVGELRNIVAILLMLNRPSITRYANAPAARGWIKRKPAPFMAHTSVTIDIDARPTMRLLGTPAGDGVPRRRHEVRGHYCHDHEAHDYRRIAGCQHDWQETDAEWTPADLKPGEAEHWVCRQCSGKRWWRIEHERGRLDQGIVNRAGYHVTAS